MSANGTEPSHVPVGQVARKIEAPKPIKPTGSTVAASTGREPIDGRDIEVIATSSKQSAKPSSSSSNFMMRDAIPISELLDEGEDNGNAEEAINVIGQNGEQAIATANGTALAANIEQSADPSQNMESQQNVKNLIMAAIGVMKNRKARPDTKRICNWIHRRYGCAYKAISDELERLVKVGELARVDYKGSSSFRITNCGTRCLNKRKMKDQNMSNGSKNQQIVTQYPPRSIINAALGTSAASLTSSNGGVGVNNLNGSDRNMIMASGVGMHPRATVYDASFSGPPIAQQQQVSLRILVNDLIGETGSNATAPGCTITTGFIAQAVQKSKRIINRTAILENLNLILAREVDAGLFTKVGQDSYILPPLLTNRVIPSSQPPPVTLMREDVVTTVMMTGTDGDAHFSAPITASMQSSFATSTTASNQEPVMVTSSPNILLKHQNGTIKTEEEKKNDLIQEKLSKMSSSSSSSKDSMKSRGALSTRKASGFQSNSKDSTNGSQVGEKKLTKKSSETTPTKRLATSVNGTISPGKRGRPSKSMMQKRAGFLQKKMKNQNVERVQSSPSRPRDKNKTDGMEQGENSDGNTPGNEGVRSKREKKSRKIFDPADHDQPSRKRKLSSISPTPGHKDLDGSTLDDSRNNNKEKDVCSQCYSVQHKDGKEEDLLTCQDCQTTVHPSCMDYSDELTLRIMTLGSWQCINCKTCADCGEAKPDEDEEMLFCDSCDHGYHMSCHKPPITTKPQGRWECSKCSMPPPTSLGNPLLQVSQVSQVQAQQPKHRTSRGASSDTNSSSKTLNATNGRNARISSIEEEIDGSKSNNSSLVEKFRPILPTHLHPRSGDVPKNWEDYPIDNSIPDVSEWSPQDISIYFAKKGFPTDQTKIFLKEEIDGKSLLLLQRQDVITSLGLKLGPAVKLYNHIRKLQARRNFP